jgi:hypothetical protein
MKKSVFLALAVLFSGAAWASTDHYLLRDDTHVHHLKITKIGDDVTVSMDVNFEPNAAESGRQPCSAEVSGEAKFTSENQVVMKKQIEGEAKHCSLTINLTPTGAKVEQSPECGYYAAGICHFDTAGKELAKIK